MTIEEIDKRHQDPKQKFVVLGKSTHERLARSFYPINRVKPEGPVSTAETLVKIHTSTGELTVVILENVTEFLELA